MTNLTSASLFIGVLETLILEREFALKIVEIIGAAREDRYFHTLIYFNRRRDLGDGIYNGDMILPLITEVLQVPVIQLKGTTSFFIWPVYNRELFAIVPLNGNESQDKTLLETLWKTLRRSVKTRLLLVARAEIHSNYLRNTLEFCLKNKAWNVMAVREDILYTREFYTPQIFPDFGLNTMVIRETSSCTYFPDHVRNMVGYPLRLSLSKSSSKIYIMKIVAGRFVLGGRVGHIVEEFARKHNATIVFPHYNENTTEISKIAMEKFLENDTFDISTEPLVYLNVNDTVYSNVYDYIDWCVMVPLPIPLPAFTFYTIILDPLIVSLMVIVLTVTAMVVALTFWIKGSPVNRIDIVLNINLLNGLLGQTFHMERHFVGIRSVVYILISICGIIFNTSFVTYLQAFHAHPPKSRPILTLEDIPASGMQVAIHREEYNLLESLGKVQNFKAFAKIYSSIDDFSLLRDNYNFRFAYPVSSAQWFLHEQQQKFFSIPRFRLSHICFYQNVGVKLPMQSNSPYEDSLNRMIDQISQSGLMNFWKSLAFLEALQMKRMSLIDTSITTDFEPMKLQDMKLVMLAFVVVLGTACFCFAAEMYWTRSGLLARKLWRKVKTLYYQYKR